MKGPGKFFDGTKPVPILVEFELQGDRLIILDQSSQIIIADWPVNETIRNENQNVAIVLKHIKSNASLEILSGANIESRLFSHSIESNRSLKHIFILIFVLSSSLYALWIISPKISLYIAKAMPYEKEKEWIRKIDFSEIAKFKKCTPSQASEMALQKLISRIYPLTPNDKKYDIQISVVSSDTKNAFALPGGQIFILSSLLKDAKSPEEIAGILSHEIAHVQERHGLAAILRTGFNLFIFQFVAGDFTGVLSLDPTFIYSISSLSVDRDMETTADHLAFSRLEKTRIDSNGFKDFFSSFEHDKYSSFFSTHPSNEERILIFSKKQKQLPLPILSMKEWEELKKYCH